MKIKLTKEQQEKLHSVGLINVGKHVEVEEAVFNKNYAEWKKTLPLAGHSTLSLKAISTCLWTKRSGEHRKDFVLPSSQPPKEVKVQAKSARWELRVIIGLLVLILGWLIFALPARAQFSQLVYIEWKDGGAAVNNGFFTYPFAIDCTTNLTCTSDGSTLTISASAGSGGRWDQLTAPTGAMSLVSNADAEIMTWDFQSDFSTDRFVLKQTTGNPTDGALLLVTATDADALLAQFGASNGVQITQAGVLSALGSGGVDFGALLNYPSGCTNQFVRTIADSLTCETVVAADKDLTEAQSWTGLITFVPSGLGGLADFDIQIGDTDGTPTYGMARFGNSFGGRTSFIAGSLDLDGAVLFVNGGGPETSDIEFAWMEAGTSIRFAIPSSGADLGTYSPRSLIVAGPAPANSNMVNCDTWTTTNGNIDCDTAGTGADLFVQDDLEVEGLAYLWEGIAFQASPALLTGEMDAGGATSFEIPNAAAPTVDAFGEIAGDNNFYAGSRGVATFFDGTAATHFVGVLNTDSPSDGQVPKWNTGGTITWENDDDTGGATAWDAIGDAGGDGSIDFVATEQDIVGQLDAASEVMLTVTNQDADAANSTTILSLQHNDGADAEVVYLSMIGDADGSPSNDYLFTQVDFTSLLPIVPPAEAYDATNWDGDTGAPQKDAVRDKIETLAPSDATYITQTSDAGLSAEQALDALASGIMRVDTAAGVITSLTNSAGIIANIDDETGTGVMVFGTTPTIATPVVTGKSNRNAVSVDDDDCTGEQGEWWYDDTDSRFEFCNADSGTPTVLGNASFTASSSDTLTNKTYDVEGTGNVFTSIFHIEWQAGTCIGAAAASNFDDSPTLTEPAAACVAGSVITSARLDFDKDTDEGMQISFVLPTGFTGTADFDFWWHGTPTANDVVWALETTCVADAETLDPAFNAAQTVTDTAKGTANQLNIATISTVTLTGCAAEERMFLQISRDANNGADDFDADARLVSTRFTGRRTQ